MGELKKVIRCLLNEIAGVPDNIVEMGEFLYEKFLFLANLNRGIDRMNGGHVFEGNFSINDFKFSTLDLKIILKESYDIHPKKFHVKKMAIIPLGGLLAQNFFSRPMGTTITIEIDMVYDGYSNNINRDLIEFIQKNKSYFLGGFVHELKHAYDLYKNDKMGLRQAVDYMAAEKLDLSEILAVKRFLYMMYFIHDIENGVKASEMMAITKTESITKEKFKSFLETTEIYKLLLLAKKYSFEQMRNELLEDINNLKMTLFTSGMFIAHLSDDEIIDEVLRSSFEVIKDYKNKIMKLLGCSKDFINHLNSVTTGDDHITFFKKEIDKINIGGRQGIRKIAGIFDLLPKG